MGNLNFKEEKRAWRQGHKNITGIDESGRGCLAGPVVAAAISLEKPSNYFLKKLPGLNDSKKMSSRQREKIFEIAREDPQIKWSVSKVSEKTIDRINILEAAKLAMKRAVLGLDKESDFLLIDGTSRLDLGILQKTVVRGDGSVFSCALASVFAKVVRDRAMVKYHKKYPFYGFDKHKGYSTKLHQQRINQYGLCRIHRKSYSPCQKALAKKGFSC